jgi:hypothetical protein
VLQSIPSRVYMEPPKRPNYPYLITRDTCPSRANLKSSDFLHRTDAQRPQPCLASTQALRSRRVSSASKLLGGGDLGGQTAPLGGQIGPGGLTAPPGRLYRPGWPHLPVESSVLVLWLNRVTKWFSGEPLQSPRTRCSLR